MTQDEIVRMLEAYRECVGRCGYLRARVEVLQAAIRASKNHAADDLAGSKSSGISETPRKGVYSSPTERAGLLLASGYVPEAAIDMTRELESVKGELLQKQLTVNFVDAWMKGLSKKERWIIERKIFDGLTYAEVGHIGKAEFGAEYSRYILQRMRKDAILKICRMAK